MDKNNGSKKFSEYSKRPYFQTVKLDPINQENQNKNVLFKKGKRIGLDLYNVEIATTNDVFSVTLENVNRKAIKMRLEYPKQEAFHSLDKH